MARSKVGIAARVGDVARIGLRRLQILEGETFRILILNVHGLPLILWVDPGTIGAAAQKLIDSMEFLPADS